MQVGEMAVDSTVPKRQVIFTPETEARTVYLLKKGHVKLSRLSDDGQMATLAVLGPGEIFGEAALLGQDVQGVYAEAMEDAYICAIPRDRLLPFIKMKPEVALKLIIALGLGTIYGALYNLRWMIMALGVALLGLGLFWRWRNRRRGACDC